MPDCSTLPTTYHSYLVRLWQEQGQVGWRASIQDIQTGVVTWFADTDALLAFLQAQTTSGSVAAGSSATASSLGCNEVTMML